MVHKSSVNLRGLGQRVVISLTYHGCHALKDCRYGELNACAHAVCSHVLCTLVAVCGTRGDLLHVDYATATSQNQMRASIAISARNLVLSISISLLTHHGCRPRDGVYGDSEMFTALLSAQRCVRRSLLCLARQNSCLHVGPKSQNHRSVCGACGACSTLRGASGH